MRWALHRLGAEILRRASSRRRPVHAEDPALLAFCGLPPDAPVPQPLVAPPNAAALLVRAHADALVAGLRTRLAGRDVACRDDTALLAGTVRRRGEVVADPGWIEVELGLDEVSVDLRVAGLDLDPGWFPALGCVVRFRYV
jgi:hypothetical protein